MPELNGDEAEVRDEEVTLDLGEPSPEVMEYARRELGETDEVKCQTIQELRDMIYERGECLPHRMDDDFLVRFLRVKNFNVNRAHRLIVNYYNFKEEHPEIHQDVNPLEMKHIGEDDVMTVPSYRTNCGRRMMIYRLGNWDPRKYPVEEIFKATVIILELGVLEPRAQILGGVAIFDLQGITMSHAWTITPQVANMVIALMVTAFPMKTTAIHILHQSWVFDVIFAVFKPLLDVRMQNKIYFHGSNMDSLHQHIAPSHLPKKYGGTREELPYYKWMDNLSKDLRVVKEMMQVGYVIHPDLVEQMGLPIEKIGPRGSILSEKRTEAILRSMKSVRPYLWVPLINQRAEFSRHGGIRAINLPFERAALTVTLSIGAMLLGASSYSLTEFQQRRAFLETRQSLEVQLVIEEQSAEQERLLLSVLPEHVAVKMRQDLGASLDTQFKKIYMSRHENVSILYADIVGFTAISSTYSASELVKILNELFARFDQLSERYEQLRIKILGDCYYCISGAPVERPDHAVLCVYMGLSMVDAIKYVQQTTNSPVDMRVGIHTGAVLAGVLGQRQWQFDVYSKDVELANKMESSGRAGRVHISNVTLSFLNGEFEVEPARGEDREEALQKAGLVTYFIVRALKPFKPAVTKSLASLTDQETSRMTMESARDIRNKEDSEEFRQRLRKELDSKGGGADLKGHAHWLTLRFKDTKVESAFHHAEEAFSPLSLIGGPLIMVCAAPVWRFQPWGLFTWGGLMVVVLFAVVLAGATCLGSAIKAMWLRRALALMMTFSLGDYLLLDMSNCVVIEEQIPAFNATTTLSTKCPYPSYYSYIGVLTLVAISMPTYICYLGKAYLMYSIAGIQCFINIWLLGSKLDWEDHASSPLEPSQFPSKYCLSATLLIVATSLVIVARYAEKSRRMLYLRGREVVAQRERAADMTCRNGVLIYNILPPHVAAYFLSRARHHDDLYSQSYAEVGVLFASMPNFADFYSEESINNQGLECLRFLNEVISDFDAILDQHKFKDIIKIKTIGSTYMAASGITESDEPEDAPRWNHLCTLVEFALELKKALSSINEQSFNHFVLKMGINHGPVTAGVIGARKPHYDIWGNTVNVASRMESTGRVGCIQVTDETRRILEPFGFGFEQRGLVFVKGKGQLLTHYLVSKDGVSLNLDSDLPVEPTHPIIYQ